MKLRHLLFAAALVLTATTAWARELQRYLDGCSRWTVDRIRRNPGGEKGSRNVNKIIVNVAHFDIWDYGSNFFNVDILFSNANEPANNSPGGSTEFYARLSRPVQPGQDFRPQHQVRADPGDQLRIRWRRRIGKYPVRAGQEAAGAWVRTSTSTMPAGFLNIGVHVSKEWNNNGFYARVLVHGGPVNFNATPEFEFVWLYPLASRPAAGLPGVHEHRDAEGQGRLRQQHLYRNPGPAAAPARSRQDAVQQARTSLTCISRSSCGSTSSATPPSSGSEEVSPEIGIEYHF